MLLHLLLLEVSASQHNYFPYPSSLLCTFHSSRRFLYSESNFIRFLGTWRRVDLKACSLGAAEAVKMNTMPHQVASPLLLAGVFS
ncbi:hypothetical protein BT96DRAFT_1008818 [Gymnopus androsaceus JB14]|uniref:Uncharacterized protein n=1 Tax=Gymnopus androsaceus JB14 TaxID=1447944 RepID=A0A6A4GDW8_9AGAR|nr:hypothetical protein BT96DRAFT_1008818 [Gymnopus androsaceus JB14]